MARVPTYAFNRSPRVEGGNIRPIDSGAAAMAGKLAVATRETSQATQKSLLIAQQVGNEWQQQMDKLQLTDAETKLSSRYRQRLFDTKTQNKLGKSIGITERELSSLSELDEEEFYNSYSPFLRKKLELLNQTMQNRYLSAVQSFELTEAGKYEVQTVTNYLAGTVQEMIDMPIGNVEMLFEKSREMQTSWSGQYPIKVQKAIDSGITNAVSQWAWESPNIDSVKKAVTDNAEGLMAIMGTEYDKLMPSINRVENARITETNRLKAKAKEEQKLVKEAAQRENLVALETGELTVAGVLKDNRLPPVGAGSQAWFIDRIKDTVEKGLKPPSHPDFATWGIYNQKAWNGELTEDDRSMMYRLATPQNGYRLTPSAIDGLFRINDQAITNAQKPIYRASKDAVKTIERRILKDEYYWGGDPVAAKNAYDAGKELEAWIDEQVQADKSADEIIALMGKKDSEGKTVVDKIADSYQVTKAQARDYKQKKRAKDRLSMQQVQDVTTAPVTDSPGVERLPGETAGEYLKRIEGQ